MILLSALLLTGMQTADRLEVEALWDGETCRTSAAGETVTDDVLSDRAQHWRKRWKRAHLTFQQDTPYRCIVVVLSILRGADFVDVEWAPPATAPFDMMAHLTIPPGRCRVRLNGREMQLSEFRRVASKWRETQPELHFQPHPQARYPCVDRVISILAEAQIHKMGFIGNEQYAPEAPK